MRNYIVFGSAKTQPNNIIDEPIVLLVPKGLTLEQEKELANEFFGHEVKILNEL